MLLLASLPPKCWSLTSATRTPLPRCHVDAETPTSSHSVACPPVKPAALPLASSAGAHSAQNLQAIFDSSQPLSRNPAMSRTLCQFASDFSTARSFLWSLCSDPSPDFSTPHLSCFKHSLNYVLISVSTTSSSLHRCQPSSESRLPSNF